MPDEPTIYALRARYVYPVDRPPLRDGIVTVRAGRILAVGENLSGQPPQDLGNVALLPGLINAHTHLEFSLLDQPLGSSGMAFSQWISQVIAHRRALLESEPDLAGYRRRAVEQGLRESRSHGVAALGEIATPGWPLECFAAEPRATIFLELLGLASERIDPLMTLAREHVSRRVYEVHQPPENSTELHGVLHTPYTLGLSPHAPYTVHPELLKQACALSAEARIPLAMHLAESVEELELLQSHSGGLVELLQSLNAWQPASLPRGLRPLDYLEQLAQAHRALIVHGNFLLRDELDFLAARRDRMTVVYCPRTHAYFPHGQYPLAEMLAAGVRVALGTDSRASNPDLSLLAEMRHIARHHPTISPAEILQLGTINGAESLGLASELGTLTPGKLALFCTVPLTDNVGDPSEQIFSRS